MICLRCGYCCFHSIVIINPKSVKEDLDLDHLAETDMLFLDGSKKCPHLSWDDNKAVCAIHHYNWFKDTPCGNHSQVEVLDTNVCRMGTYMRKPENIDLWKKRTLQISDVSC